MAEEFQNTISIYGPVDAVENTAQEIGSALFENMKSASTTEFIWLWNGVAEPAGAEAILSECLADSIVFDGVWAKISLAFQTRRGPFPVGVLAALMKQNPEIYMEIETLGDCSGLTGILAREGNNLALRKLALGIDTSKRSSLFTEHFSYLACRSNHPE